MEDQETSHQRLQGYDSIKMRWGSVGLPSENSAATSYKPHHCHKIQKMMDAQAKDLETKRLSLIQIRRKQDSMYRMKSHQGRDTQFSRTKRNAAFENLHPDRLPTINAALAVVSQLPNSYKEYNQKVSQSTEDSNRALNFY